MIEPTRFSPAAVNYARAVMELADEQGLVPESIGAELNDLKKVIDESEIFRLYIADPALGTAERWNVLKKVFGGRVSPVVLQMLGILNEKGRLPLLPEIAGAYADLLDHRLGRIEVDLIVSQKLTPDQLEEAKRRISAALKKEAVVHVYLDEKIIGGLVLRVQDQLIDASVKNQLDMMREKLLASRPK